MSMFDEIRKPLISFGLGFAYRYALAPSRLLRGVRQAIADSTKQSAHPTEYAAQLQLWSIGPY